MERTTREEYLKELNKAYLEHVWAELLASKETN